MFWVMTLVPDDAWTLADGEGGEGQQATQTAQLLADYTLIPTGEDEVSKGND